MVIERACRLPARTAFASAGLIALALIFLAGCASTRHEPSYIGQEEIDDVQYLSSYGYWTYMPDYGTVWCPNVVHGWQPFYYGHWIWTDGGWTWTSYEPYGWLVYHYGFWGYGPEHGWFWVPGDKWYPATVQWYIIGDYAGWAPMPPPGIVWLDPWDPYVIDVWIVIDMDDFTREDVGSYRVDKPVYREIASERKIIKRAPEVREVEDSTMRKVPVMEVVERPVNIRRRTAPVQPSSSERADTELKRIVLPKTEERKVEERAARIEKEVLTRRKDSADPPERSSERSSGERQDSKKRRER